MKNFFPSQGKTYTYFQLNRSDDLGSIWSSFNLDFQSNLGTMRVSPRMRINTQTSDQANLGSPVNFKFFDNRYFTIAGARIFKNTSYNPASAFVEDASTGVQTNYIPEQSDIEVFDLKLWTTGNNGLRYKVANGTGTGAWTLLSSTPSGTSLLIYSRKWNRLYVTLNSSQVDSTDGTTYTATGDYTLQLGNSDENTITSVCETSDYIWLGTTNRANENGRGSVYQWDGISAGVVARYYLNAPGAYSMVTIDDIPYVMDTFGILSKFTGSSFEEVGRLPFSDLLLSDNSTGFPSSNTRFIHPKGMLQTRNKTILAFVKNNYDDATDSISENAPSGIYEFSEDFGFTHKYSLSYNTVGSSTITDYGQNKLGTAADDGFVSGLAHAYTPTSSATRNGMIMCGATFFINQTQQTSAIFINDSLNTIQKKGYFVTTWFSSDEIQDKWTRLWAVYRRLLSANSSIVFKYRIYEEEPLYANITWVNTTSFTTTTNPTAYAPTAAGFNGTIGGEVEGIQGTGSGQCAHITSIVNNAGTYTVTVDTAFTGVTTGTAVVRFQKWIKLFPEITGQIKSYEQMAIGANNTRIQIKGCLTFQGNDEFFKLALSSNEDIKITP